MTDREPRPAAGLSRIRSLATLARRARAGPWQVAVTEASMVPTIQPGDWLLIDPTTHRWPRRGAIVVFREPLTASLR